MMGMCATLFYGSNLSRTHVMSIGERTKHDVVNCSGCKNKYPNTFKFCPQCSTILVKPENLLHTDTLDGSPPDGRFFACRIEQFGIDYYIVIADSVVRQGFGEGYLPGYKSAWGYDLKEFVSILQLEMETIPAPKWRLIAYYG